jgi:hypothetical protein
MLIDNPQDGMTWGALGAVYYFKDGVIDDRTGEIFCPARDEMMHTFNSDGEMLD